MDKTEVAENINSYRSDNVEIIKSVITKTSVLNVWYKTHFNKARTSFRLL